ncbi:hypothetical protein [Chromobacterium vaccinii]|uniref:hypothetical protein n=1 Tax=Chromobacterium vaccinii TaxID=1108595 RepID=UPI000E1775A1|nr:hypothetical protein [Chromobacterium vaccinii]SUX30682.1 Uncharacterised protein [Chromobacterium vaccinii]
MSGFVIAMILVPALCSMLCWFLLADPLRQVSLALCESGEGAPFWRRTFLLLVLATPLLTVLLLAPEQASASLWLDIREILKWALIGVVAQLLVLVRLVRLVWRQVAFSRPKAAESVPSAIADHAGASQ